MSETYSQCPKCNFKPPVALSIDTPCPKCGVYTFKWEQPLSRAPIVASTYDESIMADKQSFFASLISPMEKMESAVFYGRCLALLLLIWWSGYLISDEYRDGEIFGSFMHDILLPIHEAGHVLCMPFGEFITILGGSLFQLALPFGVCIAFIVVNRDNFGAAIGLWWMSVSLLDLSPYIYDALHPQLIMLGGHTGEDGPHDWIYLLSTVGQLRNAQHWGAFVHGFGSVLTIVALIWAGIIIWQQKQQLA